MTSTTMPPPGRGRRGSPVRDHLLGILAAKPTYPHLDGEYATAAAASRVAQCYRAAINHAEKAGVTIPLHPAVRGCQVWLLLQDDWVIQQGADSKVEAAIYAEQTKAGAP